MYIRVGENHSHQQSSRLGRENGGGRKRARRRREKEWRLPDLLYADDLALCGESEEDLRAIVGRFVKMCRRKGLKVNAD